MKAKCFVIGIFLSLVGCKEPKFNEADFIGIWKSEDGANIVINKDGTCILNELNKSIVSIAKSDDEKLTTDGTWKLIDNVNNGITGGINTGIKITYNLVDREGKGEIDFYISGQGFSENKPPWDLFIWDGDPDEMIKYKFVKHVAS
ncbi:Uncharacterised protein [Candidatus Ornithobacterium hominis]|uniref:Lipocalin-like domain-containing protein n=2 Tax=Candidatus Ornithobacterium hominis TaxID=2497989 RepID=A0A383U1T8_9FLAO|nr:Uncharacterised protein [Candidatus Ornithobacterium hominis]